MKNNNKPETCTWCSGTGKIDKKTKCPVCGGQGLISLNKMNRETLVKLTPPKQIKVVSEEVKTKFKRDVFNHLRVSNPEQFFYSNLQDYARGLGSLSTAHDPVVFLDEKLANAKLYPYPFADIFLIDLMYCIRDVYREQSKYYFWSGGHRKKITAWFCDKLEKTHDDEFIADLWNIENENNKTSSKKGTEKSQPKLKQPAIALVYYLNNEQIPRKPEKSNKIAAKFGYKSGKSLYDEYQRISQSKVDQRTIALQYQHAIIPHLKEGADKEFNELIESAITLGKQGISNRKKWN